MVPLQSAKIACWNSLFQIQIWVEIAVLDNGRFRIPRIRGREHIVRRLQHVLLTNQGKAILFSQLVLALWILITCQISLEVVLGGHYDSEVPCIWGLFFTRSVLLSMITESVTYSFITLILNIVIFLKVKCTISKRNQLGKLSENFR